MVGRIATVSKHKNREKGSKKEKKKERQRLSGELNCGGRTEPADRLTDAGSFIQFVAFCDLIPGSPRPPSNCLLQLAQTHSLGFVYTINSFGGKRKRKGKTEKKNLFNE